MKPHWETMWRFKTANFSVAWQVTECTDLDTSWIEDESDYLEKLRNGFYTAFDSRVVVYCDGEEVGCDYLGQSVYESPKDFRDHIGSQGKYGSYFTDMVRTAIAEARANVRDKQQTMQQIKIRV